MKGTKKKAEAELNRLLHQLNTGTFVEPSRSTVAEYLLQWLAFIQSKVAAKTLERYTQIVKRNLIPCLGAIKLCDLQPLHIQNYYSAELKDGRANGEGGLSPQTVLHHHRVLREALNRAVKWQLLPRNPADAVEPPKPQRKEMKTLSEAETVWMLSAADGIRIFIPLMIAVTTGMRRGEFLGLRWADIEMDAGVVNVRRAVEQTRDGLRFKSPKNGKGRQIALMPLTIEALRKHRLAQDEMKQFLGKAYQDGDLVCCREDGSIWPPNDFSSVYQRFAAKAGLKNTRLHDMRHTHATHMLGQGTHPKIVSERLGHSTIGITLDLYSHVIPDMQTQAAGKLDSVLRKEMEKTRPAQLV